MMFSSKVSNFHLDKEHYTWDFHVMISVTEKVLFFSIWVMCLLNSSIFICDFSNLHVS